GGILADDPNAAAYRPRRGPARAPGRGLATARRARGAGGRAPGPAAPAGGGAPTRAARGGRAPRGGTGGGGPWQCARDPGPRRAGSLEQRVDDLARGPGLAVTDEVGAARAGRARREVLERIEVRLRGVVDVGGVDAVAAVADKAQAPGLRAFDQARQDLLVA